MNSHTIQCTHALHGNRTRLIHIKNNDWLCLRMCIRICSSNYRWLVGSGATKNRFMWFLITDTYIVLRKANVIVRWHRAMCKHESVCAIRQSANAFRALKLADAIYLRHSKIFWTIDGHRWSHHTADNEKLMTLCRPNITNVHWWKQVNGERVRIHAVEIHTRARANIHCDNVWLCGGGV